MNHHAVLGLQQGASIEEIKKAYRKRIKECHPDAHGDTVENKARFNQLTQAYDALLDPFTDTTETSDAKFVECLDAVVPLTLDEVYTGRIVSLVGIMVMIPPGCVDGDILKGHAPSGNPVYRLTIKLREYEGYVVKGYDLHTTLYTTKRAIRRGRPIKIHNHPSWLATLKPIQILLPKDTQQDGITVHSRLGLPCDSGAPGDLYIRTQVRSDWYFIKKFLRETPKWVYAVCLTIVMLIYSLFN